MTRAELQQLAMDRIDDANVLLASKRWSAAYYLAGYAVECGLKACILAYLSANLDVIFKQRDFSKNCWSHDLNKLMDLANLTGKWDAECKANGKFDNYWSTVKDWNETFRYEQVKQIDSEAFVRAVSDPTDGVLQWITNHW
jgi:hypothetical protein